MNGRFIGCALLLFVSSSSSPASESKAHIGGEKKLNNLLSELLEVSPVRKSSKPFSFAHASDGWILISATSSGKGAFSVILDTARADAVIVHNAGDATISEGMRYLKRGQYQVRVESHGNVRIEKLSVKAFPELIHCGLGFDPAIKSYGHYDLNFLKKDILPNVTTLVIPQNIQLSNSVIDDWHGQGKRFVAEAGINSEGKTAEEHFKYWSGFYERAPFIDGIIINEFIVNNPSVRPGVTISPERQKRMEQEQQRHEVYRQALEQLRADERYKDKMVYAYVGGSGKKLNQEMIGTNLIRSLINCDYRVALERYLHEMSSEKGSKEALQTFIDGISDWEAKEPGAKKHMVIAFGLFSMPPGGINKQPNVDYHVWMDQQMNIVANHPAMRDVAGIEWWTTSLADEETVRFVGKLYRHYAIEGRREMLTKDPLFLTHLQNTDFENGLEGWTLHSAEDGSIEAKRFPRYGRIEGRFMGLGRPPDPEHIGDTFLWMKRSVKGANSFSQTIKDLQPGRLYSMKMFSCDYNDLVNQKTKKMEEATKFIGRVTIDGVDIDTKRSFNEMYSSTPEPRIPIWITYHWKVFRAKGTSAKLIVSDEANEPGIGFGQEQTFNFLEVEPYHD